MSAPTCARCAGRVRGALLRCGACAGPVYCDKACQIMAWSGHKRACRAVCAAERERAAAADLLRHVQAQHAASAAAAEKVLAAMKQCSLREDHAGALAMEAAVLEEAMPVLHGNDVVLASAFLARAHCAVGSFHRATELFESARTAIENVPRSNALKGVYGTLALCYTGVGRYAEAMELQQLVLDAHRTNERERGDSAGEWRRPDEAAETMGCISDIYMAMGRYSDAERWRRDAMAVPGCTEPLSEQFQCRCLGQLGRYYAAQNNVARAYALYDRQAVLASRINYPEMKAQAVLGMGVARWAEARAAGASASVLPPGQHADTLFSMIPSILSVYPPASHLVETRRETIRHNALLYTAFTRFDAGDDDDGAIETLEALLDMICDSARAQCLFCAQIRRDEGVAGVELLTCTGCRTARFCSVACQRLASEHASVASGRFVVRHKDLCPLLAEAAQYGPAQREARLAFLRAQPRGTHAPVL